MNLSIHQTPNLNEILEKRPSEALSDLALWWHGPRWLTKLEFDWLVTLYLAELGEKKRGPRTLVDYALSRLHKPARNKKILFTHSFNPNFHHSFALSPPSLISRRTN